ncbi:MAG: beta-N-acetylhexosaminidase [Syntrophaceticus sp.]|jgi:beta-N-acetylhexosaminidase
MHKGRGILIFFLVCLAFLSGYIISSGFKLPFPRESEQQQNDISEKPDQKEVDPIKEQLDSLTLQEKIGQMVIVGIEGEQISDSERQLIEENHVGGIILFKRNIQNANQMLSLINELKKTNSSNKIPLFLSIDEEGGKVTRMPDEINKLPVSAKVGESSSPNLAFQIGEVLGQELNSFGLNMNFAPVLDINSNPNNPVIGERAFGTAPELVSKLGTQTMKGIQSQNVISVVKHFPGHGDTSVDSHVGLPSVDHDLDRLKSFELKPFASAIQNGADAVMIAHISLPKIDANHPASLSQTVITDILRNELQFDGVVLTDDMTMGAIVNNYDLGEAAVESINAGSDIVLVCHSLENEKQVIDALTSAVETDTIPIERVNESVYRILKLKQKYRLTDQPADSVDIDEINSAVVRLLEKL